MSGLNREDRGGCDPPDAKNKEIVVREGMGAEETLEVILHECLHAGLWGIDEEVIDQLGKDLARLLHRRLGYRRIDL